MAKVSKLANLSTILTDYFLPGFYRAETMATGKKPKRVWVYLSEEDQGRLNSLVSAVGTLNEVMILSTLVSAALKACDQAGTRMPLPLKFQITEGLPENEPKPLAKGRR